jgi:hypothetical protein
MTKLLIATLTGLVAGLSAAPEAPAPRAGERVAVVVDASGPAAPQRIAAARAEAARRHAPLRAPASLREQVSTTALLAAEGYTTIVGFDVNEHAAIEPLRGTVRYVNAASKTVSSE